MTIEYLKYKKLMKKNDDLNISSSDSNLEEKHSFMVINFLKNGNDIEKGINATLSYLLQNKIIEKQENGYAIINQSYNMSETEKFIINNYSTIFSNKKEKELKIILDKELYDSNIISNKKYKTVFSLISILIIFVSFIFIYIINKIDIAEVDLYSNGFSRATSEMDVFYLFDIAALHEILVNIMNIKMRREYFSLTDNGKMLRKKLNDHSFNSNPNANDAYSIIFSKRNIMNKNSLRNIFIIDTIIMTLICILLLSIFALSSLEPLTLLLPLVLLTFYLPIAFIIMFALDMISFFKNMKNN